MRKCAWRRAVALVITAGMLAPATAAAQDAPPAAQEAAPDWADMSLESLMRIRVRSVAREEKDFLRTSAAIYVITEQDIRRSGATDIAELLRAVPGVNVAQINSSTWAVGVRGFNMQHSTKLLVMVDGRSVYDPGFSGVWWHMQNIPLADIERIEVIRGPGATMWGANAVNGVISITTKRAEDTLGGHFDAGFGTRRPGEGSFRFGGKVGETAFYRVFTRQTTRTESLRTGGATGGDEWNNTDAGLRFDWEPSLSDSFTFEAGANRGVTGSRQPIITAMDPVTFGDAGLSGNHGGHLTARWHRSLAARSDLTMQFYYDTRRHTAYGEKKVDTIDLDVQHSFPLGTRHHLTWGAGYRRSADEVAEMIAFRLTPTRETVRLGSIFVQDEITLVPERLFVTVGSKFEESSFSGGNVQPAVRAVWQPTRTQSLWGAIGRAVRTPNRVERGITSAVASVPMGPMNGIVQLMGHESATSEELLAREVGYRIQPHRRLWFDVAAFYNRYEHLSVVDPGEPYFEPFPAPAHMVLPQYLVNSGRGTTHGGELTAQYQPREDVTVKGSYSALRMDIEGTTVASTAENHEGQTPQHQLHVGTTVNLPASVDVSGNVYRIGALPYFDLPAYTRLDLGASWKMTGSLRLNLNGQNLLQSSHREFGDIASPANAVSRGVHAGLSVDF